MDRGGWKLARDYSKDLAVVASYPRSGSNFVMFAINSIFPSIQCDMNTHSTLNVDRHFGLNTKLVGVIRSPKEAIASWHLFRNNEREDVNFGQHYSLDKDIEFYIRFNTYIFENMDKMPMLHFDDFVNNTEYIKEKVKDYYQIDGTEVPTALQVNTMVKDAGRESHLPRENAEGLSLIYSAVENEPLYKDSLNIYNKIIKNMQ